MLALLFDERHFESETSCWLLFLCFMNRSEPQSEAVWRQTISIMFPDLYINKVWIIEFFYSVLTEIEETKISPFVLPIYWRGRYFVNYFI